MRASRAVGGGEPADALGLEEGELSGGEGRHNVCYYCNERGLCQAAAPLELQATVPDYMVPFAPILQQGEQPFSMFVDLQNKYDWVLQPVVGYPSVDRLIEVLEDKVVRPAEAKFNELLARRTNQLRVEIV